MLKKKYCLSKKKDFEKVFKEGKSLFNSTFGVKKAENNLDYSRFAVLVGKKINKRAVIRNKQKRRVKAILRKNFSSLKEGYDVIIITQPEILEKNFNQLSAILKGCLKRLDIFKE